MPAFNYRDDLHCRENEGLLVVAVAGAEFVGDGVVWPATPQVCQDILRALPDKLRQIMLLHKRETSLAFQLVYDIISP